MGNVRAIGLISVSLALVLASLTAATPQPGTVVANAPGDPLVGASPVEPASRDSGAEDSARPVSRGAPVYPTAGTRRVALPRTDSTGTTEVVLETLDPTAVARLGGAGLGVRVSRADDRRVDEQVRLELDYSGFADAHGADFAGRLRVVEIPGRKWVPARNDPARQRFTVELTPGPSSEQAPVLMLASAAGGSFAGNFGATDLSPTGSWQTGLSSGSFTYSYPVPVPASPQGKGPDLAFRYNSSAVDGMTASTNAQAGWTGLGWQLGSDYIERRYKPCAEDAVGPGKKSKQRDWGHFCWESPDENDGQAETTDPTNSELHLSLGGRSSRIVKDRLTGTWKTQEDFGWKLEHVTGGSGGQPYWLVTTQKGDVHRFGFRRDSVWQVPIAGDDPGEPCHDRYANSGRSYPGMCDAPWRWNLDQIVDANENLTTLHWKRESGQYSYYESELCCGAPATYQYTPIGYDRGGYLDRIEWGANTSVAGSVPTTKVVFNMVSRCSSTTDRDDPLSDPYPIDTGTGNLSCLLGDWDVPDDLVRCDTYQCNSGSPAFFIMRRLDSVVTHVLDGATGTWDDVHKLQLRFKYVRSPESGSGTSALWLDYIRPVGLSGAGEVRLPAVDFDAVALNGRVDWGTDFFLTKPKAVLPRIATVHNGHGGRIEVSYGRPNACPDGGAAADGYRSWYNAARWDRNDQDCFRSYDFWFPFGGGPEVIWGVYHKYHVTKVVERDTVAASPEVVTAYEYQGRPAWAWPVHYLGTKLTVPSNDTGGTARIETASWNEARGYETVRTLKGSGADPAGYTVTTDTFFRGMFEDVHADGTRKQSRVTDFDGGAWDDLAVLTGRSLQTTRWTMTSHTPRQYTEGESTRHEYARVGTGDGPGVLDPGRVDDVRTRGRQAVDAGGFRYTDLRTTYDTYGLPTRRNDHGVDGLDTDNTCTTTRYARSTTLWLLSYPAVVEERKGDSCTTGTITARTELAYDNAAEPSDGNVTQERRWVDAGRIAVTRASFDDYGRVVSVTDPLGKVTTTTHDPAVGFPDAGVTTTNPANHQTTTWSSRAHGQPVKIRDPQGGVTELDYDPLGRAIAVWGPGEPRGGGTPSSRMSYAITYDGGTGQPTAPVRTLTEKLLTGTGAAAKWQAGYTFDDGFGRTREAQTPSPAGGRVVVASLYDGRGKLSVNTAPMHNSSAPGSGLLNPAAAAIPQATRYVRDGAERTTAGVHTSLGAEQRRVAATYSGENLVTVSPPTGGSTEYWFDTQDQVTKVVERDRPGVSRQTLYEYDTDGNVTKITDARGNVRTFQYDWQGRVVAGTDPDSGNGTWTYDLGGRLLSTVDGRGQKLSYGYDDMGRKTVQWAGEKDTGVKLAEWTYDNVARGRLDSSTRWVGSAAYRHEITAYDADYRATASRITVPAVEGALAGTYSFTAAYNRAGQRTEVGVPAAGGLPSEKVTATYNDQGLAKGLTSNLGGLSVYVKDTAYTGTGKLSHRSYGPLGHLARKLTWDPATDRLANATTLTKADTATPVKVQDDDFHYDNGNNIVRVADKTAIVDGRLGVQSECFDHDGANRLSFAWTTTEADCSGGPQNSPDGKGPDPYRQAFTYDEVGNLAGVETDGRKADYAYPATGTARPNAVTAIAHPDRTDSYGYDGAGRMTSRTVAGATTTLTWDETGQLGRTTADGRSTDYVYDADGERLVRRGPDGTTVYLGEMELRESGGAVTASRYYAAGDGAVVAVRNARGLTWLAADPQRSEQLAIDDATGRVDRQRYLPFGGHRGGRDDISATERGFLGKTEDPDTGLTLLSARYYDPAIGKFLSPDPALDLRDPQWMNTYAYAGNNPVSRTDPGGMASCSSTTKSAKCMPDAEALRGKQKSLAQLQHDCWYKGKNCGALPASERTPPWKRAAPKVKTVEQALYALADAMAKTDLSKTIHNKCNGTAPNLKATCQKAAEELGKNFNRAYVKAFCSQHKALCASSAPDYVSLAVSWGKGAVSVELSLTVTRTGHVYLSVGAGAGVGMDAKGFSAAVKVGWVYNRGTRAKDSVVANFPQDASWSASGIPLSQGEFLGSAWSESHYSVERGVAPPGVGVGRSVHDQLIGNLGPIWSI